MATALTTRPERLTFSRRPSVSTARRVSPYRSSAQSAAETSHSKVAAEVFASLFALENDLEDGDQPVTPFALRSAGLLVPVIAQFVEIWNLQPDVATNGDGGVRISWISGGRELRAAIPAADKGNRYLYWQEGASYGSIPGFTSTTLFQKLEWLRGRRSI